MRSSERGWVRGAVVVGIAGVMMAVALLSPALAVRLATTSYVKQKVNQAFNRTFSQFLQQPTVVVRSDPIAVAIGNFAIASISCPAGGVATGGGASTANTAEDWEMEASYPSNGASPAAGTTGWTAVMENIAGGTSFRVYAVCAGGVGVGGNFTPGSPARSTGAEWAPDASFKPEVNVTVQPR